MADDPITGDGGTAPAPDAPATAPDQLRELIAQGIQSAFDARIPGLQGAYERQVASLKKELNDIRRSSLSEDEIEDEKRTELEAELAKARSEAAALRAAQRYPQAYGLYERLMSAASVDDQLKILDEASRASVPPTGGPAPAGDASPGPAGTPPIDPNNPRREPSAGGKMTPELADRILDQFDRWPTFGG